MKRNTILYLGLAMLFLLFSCGETKTDQQAVNKPPVKTVQPVKQPPRPAQRQQPSVPTQQGKINWISFEELQKKQKQSPKKVMVDVYTEWCGPCKMLDRYTFADKRVADFVNENYYAVKFNAQHENAINYKGKKFANPNYDPKKGQKRRNATHELARAFGVRSYPTVMFLDEKLNVIQKIPGFRKADQFIPVLQQMKTLKLPS